MTTPDALATLEQALALLDSVPSEALPDNGRVYNPAFWLFDGKRAIGAALKGARECLENPPAKKGRKQGK